MTTSIIFILYFCVAHLVLLGLLYLNKPVEPVHFNTLLARCYLWPTLIVSSVHAILISVLASLFDRFSVWKEDMRDQIISVYEIALETYNQLHRK